MILPILMLLASFVAATMLGLAGAYVAGMPGAMVGMAIGIVVTFLLMARRAGR